MTNSIIGYSRVSTTDQNPEAQNDALKTSGAERIFSDVYTGTKSSRPEFDKAIEYLRSGDTLVVTRLDRLGRSTKDLLNISEQLRSRDIGLRVTEQNIDTATAEGRLFFTIISAFAEFEHTLIVSRTKDGLAAAKARGRVGGRKPLMSVGKVATAKQMYVDGKSVKDIAEILGVSRPTIYRALENK